MPALAVYQEFAPQSGFTSLTSGFQARRYSLALYFFTPFHMAPVVPQTAPFPIAHLHRVDLRTAGFDVSRLSDEDIHELTHYMEDAYIRSRFWLDLEHFATRLDFPRY